MAFLSSITGDYTDYIVRVTKDASLTDKKYSLLKFNGALNVDVGQWTSANVSLQREDNEATYTPVDKGPKAGVGSEFGKLWRDEARRKKMGYASAKYSKDAQPWILTQNADSSNSKKYRGIKEGGLAQNADYWVFIKSTEPFFDACPIDELYNFMPIARYKTLDAEEAEEKFANRSKVLNQFALKIKQQLEGDSCEAGGSKKREDDEEDLMPGKNKNKIQNSDDEDIKPTKSVKTKKKRQLSKQAKKSQKIADDGDDLIASADSDDGDSEGREVDYMTDSDLSFTSEEEPEDDKVRKALVGVDEEDGMKKLIESDQDDEQGVENEDEEEEDEGKRKFDAKSESMPTIGGDLDEKVSDSGSDSDDPDEDTKAPFFMQDIKASISKNGTNSQQIDNGFGASSQNGSIKRKATDEADSTSIKKIKTEKIKSEDRNGITLEEVKEYLRRRPQSSKDLVAKFKPKCRGMSKPEVVKHLADILKCLAPEQTLRNGTMYFSIKK